MVTRGGLAAVAVIFLAGLWLVAAPFALCYQPPRAGWTGAARADVITGAALAVTGFTGLFAVLAGRVREMYADAASAASPAASPGSAGDAGPGQPGDGGASR